MTPPVFLKSKALIVESHLRSCECPLTESTAARLGSVSGDCVGQ
jgi:hypothetical protein